MKHCPICSRGYADGDSFCPHDGGALVAGAPPRSGQTDRGGPPPAAGPAPGPAALLAAAAAAYDDGHPDGSEPGVLPPGAPTHVPDENRVAGYDRLIGSNLDARYHIERKLGEGGMGVVFLARHIVIEKLVAIKVLKREVAREHNVVKRFVQEAKAASRVSHPNIADVTDFGTTPDGLTYSVMEYVEGVTLNNVIKRGPVPVPRAVHIVQQIARALAAAHAKGIVHRDLKPENIFLIEREGKKDFVKIVDFGIAKVTSLRGTAGPRLTRAGTVFGTPEYMAPEQAAGRTDTDHRVDVYALGIVLYEMLTGQVPHKKDSVIKTLTAQINDPVSPPRRLSPELQISDEFERALLKALAKDREQRYQTMDEMAEAIAAAARSLPSVGAGPPPAQPAAPPSAGPQESTLVPRDAAATVSEGGGPPSVGMAPTPAPPPRPGDPAFAPVAKVRRFDDIAPSTYYGERKSRGGLLVVAVLLAIAGGVAAALVFGSGDSSATRAALPVAIDAAVAAAVIDAGVLRAPDDAAVAVVEPPDAGKTIAGRRRPGRRKKPPRKDPELVARPGVVHNIVVETVPRGGALFLGDKGNIYGGADGTQFTRAEGLTLEVTCRMPGYHFGKVQLVFDGRTNMATCQMARRKACVEGVKNPFDDCPDDEE